MNKEVLKNMFSKQKEEPNKVSLSQDEFKSLVEGLINERVAEERAKFNDNLIKESAKPNEVNNENDNEEFGKFIIEIGDK